MLYDQNMEPNSECKLEVKYQTAPTSDKLIQIIMYMSDKHHSMSLTNNNLSHRQTDTGNNLKKCKRLSATTCVSVLLTFDDDNCRTPDTYSI